MVKSVVVKIALMEGQLLGLHVLIVYSVVIWQQFAIFTEEFINITINIIKQVLSLHIVIVYILHRFEKAS